MFEANLYESYTILSESKGTTDRDQTDVLKGLGELCVARHAAEPDEGSDIKAAEWRTRLRKVPPVSMKSAIVVSTVTLVDRQL
ncbi:MAG: hypothetical protein HY287_08900 [Planctomycetes bacterium]|nr:hypothetical protein [Planctomycetota bacterium]